MLKKIFDITTTVIMSFVLIFAVLLVGVRIFGLKPYTVLSGSMEPTYHVGSLIYVKDVKPEDLEIGDSITYIINGNTVVTHRIIDITGEDGNIKFHTKGDNNDVADGEPVPAANIIGKPVFTIPLLGYIAYFVQNSPGNIIVFSILGLLLILTFVPDILDKIENKDKENKEDGGQKN